MRLNLNLKAKIRCPRHWHEDGTGQEITCPQCSHVREVNARWLDLMVAIRQSIAAGLITELTEGNRHSILKR